MACGEGKNGQKKRIKGNVAKKNQRGKIYSIVNAGDGELMAEEHRSRGELVAEVT